MAVNRSKDQTNRCQNNGLRRPLQKQAKELSMELRKRMISIETPLIWELIINLPKEEKN